MKGRKRNIQTWAQHRNLEIIRREIIYTIEIKTLESEKLVRQIVNEEKLWFEERERRAENVKMRGTYGKEEQNKNLSPEEPSGLSLSLCLMRLSRRKYYYRYFFYYYSFGFRDMCQFLIIVSHKGSYFLLLSENTLHQSIIR